jgi:Protein of Unknown function (DUF2604)
MNNKNQEEIFHKVEKKLEHLEEEVKEEIEILAEIKHHKEEELLEIREEIADLEHREEKHHHDTISLKFIVNGSPVNIGVKLEELLSVAVVEALKETGNAGRALSAWDVKYQDKSLDVNKTVKELGLPDCAELYVSLKAGHGGSINL